MSAETHLEVYRKLQGRLGGHGPRWWPLFTTGLRTALKQRKALLLLYLPALIVTVIMCFVVWVKFRVEALADSEGGELSFQEQVAKGLVMSQAEQLLGVVSLILNFAKGMGSFAVLAVSWFASGLVCEDRKAGAHQLYFARPVTRFDYFVGKFLTTGFFAVCAMLVPLLSVCIAASVFSPEWSFLKEEWDVFPRVLAFSLLWTVVVSSLVLMVSSVASRKSFALLGIFGFVMLSLPVGGALGDLVDERLFSIAVMMDFDAIAHWFFNRTEGQGNERISVTAAWVAIGMLLALSWLVLWLRLRRLEVVA